MGTLFFVAFLAFLGIGIAVPLVKWLTGRPTPPLGKTFLAGIPYALLGVVFFLLYMSFTPVNGGTIAVVKRFGNPSRQLSAGGHFIVPFFDDSVTPVDIQTKTVKPSEDAASHDLQVVHTEVTLAYHIDPAFATYDLVNLNLDEQNRVIIPAILEAIKSTTAQYDVKELIAERPHVRDGIETFVKARLAPYHIIAETTSITGFRFSKEFEDSIEAKVVAEQQAEKAKNDLLRIQTEAEQQVAQAKGEAEALRAQKEQITPQLLQLRTIEMMKEKWEGHLPNTIVGGNGALPMMDVLSHARNQQ